MSPEIEHSKIVVGANPEEQVVFMMTDSWQFEFTPEQAYEIGKMLIFAADAAAPFSTRRH